MKTKQYLLLIAVGMSLWMVACDQDVSTPGQPDTPTVALYPAPGQDEIQGDSSETGEKPFPETLWPTKSNLVVVPFDHEFSPIPGDEKLLPGNVYIDSSEILLLESYPVQVKLHLTGNLPTPCHQFRSQVFLPDEDNYIHVVVYSLSDPGTMCTQVLEPFDVQIALGDYTEGDFKVWVNDEQLEEFHLP
jgi:hypothetical protein